MEVDGWAAEVVRRGVTRHRYRFFATASPRWVADLSQSDQHHLTDVLRMRVGDTCEVAEGGRVWMARVSSRGLTLMEEVEPVAKAPAVTVWIAQPGARSDAAVEKLTELGVARSERLDRPDEGLVHHRADGALGAGGGGRREAVQAVPGAGVLGVSALRT